MLTFSGKTARKRYPRRRASIASAMPVLPLVGSRITRSVPGYSSPCASAASNIARAMRSLTDPDGLAPSSLAQIRTPAVGLKLGSSTNGVLPMARSIVVSERTAVSVIVEALAASHRGQDRDYVVFGDRCLEPIQVAHVFVVQIDVDEVALRAAGLEQMTSEPRVAPIDVDDQLAQGRALGGDAALAPDAGPKHGRNTYVGHQRSAQRGDRRAAERLVVDQLVDGRIVTAQRAIGVARDLDLAELHAQAVEQHQPVDQRIAQIKDELDCLDRLDRADHTAHGAQHASLGAAWDS